MIIGLTGTKASGKGVVADILMKKDFVYISLSDMVREEAVNRGIPNYTIKDLQDIGNNLRETNGNGILAKKAAEKFQEGINYVIDGIRNIGEIEVLRKFPNFTLIAVDAPQGDRFQRLIRRARPSDPRDWLGFLEMEKRDLGSNEQNSGQQVAECIKVADIKIYNDSNLEQLTEKIENTISQIKKTKKRQNYLSWDEYFMGIALLSAERSKDPSTQVGACIVNKDKKIIGLGYNGFPIGCSDEDLPWERSGSFLETKYAYVCHAELNAIINSVGKELKDCSIYVALFPCNECAKVIIQSGIKEVVYLSDKYAETDSTKAAKIMFNQSGVNYRQLKITREPIKIDFSIEK